MGTENVAEETFSRGSQTAMQLCAPIYEAFKKMIENARELTENKMVKQCLNWKDNGGNFGFNICDDSIAKELKERLKEERIPYISYSIADQFKSGVLFRDKDMEKVEAVRREILIERGGFLQEVPKSELFCASLNEKVTSVRNLTEEELEVMRNKSWARGRGFSIATEKQPNGKYTLHVRSSDLYKSNSKHNFLDAASRTAFSLYGKNKEQKMAEIKYDRELKEQIFKYGTKPEIEKMFIVSASDKTKYIELNEMGFEYHKRKEDVHSIPIAADRGSKNYNIALQQAFSAMEDCVIVSEKKFEQIQNGELSVEEMRPKRNKEDIQLVKQEKEFEKEFIEVIKDNIEEKSLISHKSKTKLYRDEFEKTAKMVCSKDFSVGNIEKYGEQYLTLAEIKEKMGNDMSFLQDVSNNFIDMTTDMDERIIDEKDYSLNDTDRFTVQQGEIFQDDRFDDMREETEVDIEIDE